MSARGDERQQQLPDAKKGTSPGTVVSGPGALCAEAQADGVPCTELGRDCEVCELAAQLAANDVQGDDPD